MGKRKRLRREIKSEINMMPLLDVLLVLVLIFMATTPIITQNIKVSLPDAADSKAIISYNHSPVIIEVSSVGHYSLVVNYQRQKSLSSKNIVNEAHAFIVIDPNTLFLIGGAKDLPYNEIIKVLNLLHQAGVKAVGLMTHPIVI